MVAAGNAGNHGAVAGSPQLHARQPLGSPGLWLGVPDDGRSAQDRRLPDGPARRNQPTPQCVVARAASALWAWAFARAGPPWWTCTSTVNRQEQLGDGALGPAMPPARPICWAARVFAMWTAPRSRPMPAGGMPADGVSISVAAALRLAMAGVEPTGTTHRGDSMINRPTAAWHDSSIHGTGLGGGPVQSVVRVSV